MTKKYLFVATNDYGDIHRRQFDNLDQIPELIELFDNMKGRWSGNLKNFREYRVYKLLDVMKPNQ